MSDQLIGQGGQRSIAFNVQGLPQGWNSCCVRRATEAD